MCDIFLKKEKGEYFLTVNGKNGEIRPDVGLNVQIMHKWFTNPASTNYNKEHQLTTDKEGKVRLGQLKGVLAVIAVAPSLGHIRQQWMIGNQDRHGMANLMTYPSQVDCIEGESLEFPVSGLRKKSRKSVSLIKLWSPSQSSQSLTVASSSSIVLEDLFEKLEVVS